MRLDQVSMQSINVLNVSCRTCVQKLKLLRFFFFFFKLKIDYFKNYLVNARLVYTHLNAFFMMSPNMTMGI